MKKTVMEVMQSVVEQYGGRSAMKQKPNLGALLTP